MKRDYVALRANGKNHTPPLYKDTVMLNIYRSQ